MPSDYAAAGLLWLVVLVYALAGCVDFGATFWRLRTAATGERAARRVAERYLSPLWEATNVFLVLIAVALVGFFPYAAYAFGSVLLLPGCLILLLLGLRGGLLVHTYGGGGLAGPARLVTGLAALLLPALLAAVLPISQGGLVRESAGRLLLDLPALLRSPDVYAYLAFGLVSALFISATFLSDYAATAGDREALVAYRSRALAAGPAALLCGIAALLLLPAQSWFAARLWAQWPWFAASLAACGLALAALRPAPPGERASGRPRRAVLLVGWQYACAGFGYGLAHAPYLLYPYAPTAASFTNRAMDAALLWVVLAGFLLLIPAFIWLWRLFVLDTRYTRG